MPSKLKEIDPYVLLYMMNRGKHIDQKKSVSYIKSHSFSQLQNSTQFTLMNGLELSQGIFENVLICW